jgi:hypothetical protein
MVDVSAAVDAVPGCNRFSFQSWSSRNNAIRRMPDRATDNAPLVGGIPGSDHRMLRRRMPVHAGIVAEHFITTPVPDDVDLAGLRCRTNNLSCRISLEGTPACRGDGST